MNHRRRLSVLVSWILTFLILAACGSPDLVVIPTLVSPSDTQIESTETAVPPTETSAPPPTTQPRATATEPEPVYQTYTIGEEISDFAVADLNGDTHPDLAVTDSGIDTLKLLFNLGDGTFQDAKEIVTGEDPYGIEAADLDGDTDLDLVVAHWLEADMGKLSILLNNGDGTFQTQIDYPTVDNAWVSAIDLDDDKDLDLVIEDGAAKDGDEFGARILLNNGNGTFNEGESYFYLPYVGSVEVGDLNGDTYPDLVVRQYPEPYVSVHFGNGDGTFGEPVNYETAASLHRGVIADLNGDPYPDVATANAQGVVSVLFNKGDGTFQNKIDYELGGDIYTIVAVDMDGDAFLDLLVGPTSSGMASLLKNTGDGTFEVTKDYYFKGAWSSWFTVYDVDGDGFRELVGAGSDSMYVFPFEDNN